MPLREKKKQDITTVLRCCNFLQIFTYLNKPALNYMNQSYVFGWNITAFQAFNVSCFGR
jgi:hypothetical protein